MEIPIIILALTTFVSGLTWGLRLEGRHNAVEQKVADNQILNANRVDGLKELINAKFDAVDDRLERIERALNGSLKRVH